MNGTDLLPPERTLPSDRRDQILRSVLSDEQPIRTPGRRVRWIAPIAVGVVAALVAVGAIVLADSDGGAPSNPPPATHGPNLDLGPLSRAEIDAELSCTGPSTSEALEGSEPLYARRIDGPNGPIPVFVMPPMTRDQVYLVDMGRLTIDRVPATPTEQRPIRRLIVPVEGIDLSGSDLRWYKHLLDPRPLGLRVYDGTPEYWKAAGLYRVADSVDRVEVRVGSPGGPEPWRVATPHNGFVFWATWIERADYEPGTELTLEVRAFDANGDPIHPELIPDRPQTITVRGPGEPSKSKCGHFILMR